MKARFFGQPYDDGSNLRDFLEETAATEGLTDLTIVVAWAKESGLSRVADQITAIRERGSARLVVGIDKGGATEQGLRLALGLFDKVWILHRGGAVTFHPKVFLAEGDGQGLLLVGSNNLTAGGVYSNYEAALVLDLDLADRADSAVIDEVNQYIALLLEDADVCLELDAALLDVLVADERYQIADESKQAAEGRTKATDEEGGAPEDPVPSLFGKSKHGGRKDPGRKATPARDRGPSGASASGGGGASASPPAPAGGGVPTPPPGRASAGGPPTVVKRWTKELTYSDAQQKRTANTKVTGNMKLTEAGHPAIDHTIYFRHDFFGPLSWGSQPKPKGTLETASVTVELVVNGVSEGRFVMVVDHADYRISDQSNVPTWLKWKEASAYMKGHDHVGDWVSLERLSDGSYRLQIAPAPTGPFLV